LKQVVDLGAWWEDTTGLPVPLGGIIAKRTLGKRLLERIDRILRHSIEFAMNNRGKPLSYVKQYSQELSEEVIAQHINLYVNNYSLDIGKDGERAIRVLIQRAEEAGIIPRIKVPIFYED
jgi:1,4-dihydroxy-6-naphthoate synthase